jgi:hypothetical protein
MSALYAVPIARRAQSGAATAVLAVALLAAGVAPLTSSAPGWLRIAGVLVFLVGALLALIAAGLLNTVRIERAQRRAFAAEAALDAAAARVFADNGALECADDAGSPAGLCGADGCGGACALAALRPS